MTTTIKRDHIGALILEKLLCDVSVFNISFIIIAALLSFSVLFASKFLFIILFAIFCIMLALSIYILKKTTNKRESLRRGIRMEIEEIDDNKKDTEFLFTYPSSLEPSDAPTGLGADTFRDIEEFIAVAFAIWVEEPSILESKQPEIYKIFEDHLRL